MEFGGGGEDCEGFEGARMVCSFETLSLKKIRVGQEASPPPHPHLHGSVSDSCLATPRLELLLCLLSISSGYHVNQII